MSEDPTDLDARLLGILYPDEAFRQAVCYFVQTNAPSAPTPHLRSQLESFLNAFYRTSEDVHMQELLLMLHDMYSLDGLVGPFLIRTIRPNVLALQASRTSQYPPLTTAAPDQLPQTQNLPPTTLTQEAQSDLSNWIEFRHVSMEEAAEIREEDTEDTEAPPSSRQPAKITKSRPNSQAQTKIPAMDPHWLYKCDVCSRTTRYCNEFHRHIKRHGTREGFKVDCTTTNMEPYRWHAADTAGNEYEGDMVHDASGPVRQGGK